jgi:hypothetical protein
LQVTVAEVFLLRGRVADERREPLVEFEERRRQASVGDERADQLVRGDVLPRAQPVPLGAQTLQKVRKTFEEGAERLGIDATLRRHGDSSDSPASRAVSPTATR